MAHLLLRSKPVPGRTGEVNRHLALIRHILQRDAAERVWCTAPQGRTALRVAAMQARAWRADGVTQLTWAVRLVSCF